jgi:hypothetical protein
MNSEIMLERCGDAVHLIYRHFHGSFPGTFLGNRLRLKEVEVPVDGHANGHQTQASGGHAVEGLELGQYCLIHPESNDSEMHALLPASQLGDVQQAVVHDLHIPVTVGSELFPPDIPPAGDSAGEASPSRVRARLLGAFLALAILSASGFVLWRLIAPEELPMAALIARMEAPTPANRFDQVLRRWGGRNVRIPLRDVLFLSETKLVLADGAFVAIEGAGDLLALGAMAGAQGSVPVIEARLGATFGLDPDAVLALPLKRMRCGRTTFAQTGTLKPIAILAPSTERPSRTRERNAPDQFRIVGDLRFDDRRTFEPLLDERISLRGWIAAEGSRRVLRLANGTGVALVPLPAGSRVEPFLAGIAGDKTEIEVDLILERAFPWKNRQDPAESRQASRIAAVGRVVAVSADQLFLTDAR